MRAVLPHTALRSVVLPLSGLTSQDRGSLKGKEPLFDKECIFFASFHAVLQRCQHTVCPDTWFYPMPSHMGFSGLFSRLGHCRRYGFRVSVHSLSTFLCPFAPQELPCFIATMSTLNPVEPAPRPLGHRRRPFYSTGLPASRTRPFQPFRPQTPDRPLTTLLHTTPQRVRHPVSAGSGFTIWLQARRTDPAESGSFVLRTGCSPPVTPHPASRRRSYSYLLAGACLPGGDFHPSDQVRLQAYSQGRKPLGKREQCEPSPEGAPGPFKQADG